MPAATHRRIPLTEVLHSAGAATWLALGSSLVALAIALVLGWLARSRIRVPAVFWLLPGLLVYGELWLVSILVGRSAVVRAETAPLDEVVALGTRGLVDVLRVDGLGLGLAGVLLLATGWIAALAHGVSTVDPKRERRYRTAWGQALLPGVLALPGGVVLLAMGLWLETPATGAVLGTALVGGLLALSVVSSQRARASAEDRRLGAARGLVAACTVVGVIALGMASAGLIRASGLSLALTLTLDDRPALVTAYMARARSAEGLGLLGGGLGLLVGTLSILLTPRALGSWRSILGAWAALALLLVVPGARLGRTLLLDPLVSIPAGGAVADQPEVRRAALPRARDLAGLARVDEGLTGSCLVIEHPTGWAARPLYALVDQEAAILSRADGEVEPLERKPGCPPREQPLEEPFSTYESPVILVDRERLAPLVSGHRWFLRQGTLRLLLGPEAAITEDDPPRARAWRYRTVPMDWELAPEGPPVADGGDHWDFEAAATLPVTLLEGPRPLLVAGGTRDYIDFGAQGASELRDALLGAEDRRLVLVPRKHWTVQDLVAFCLTVYGHVEGARCVIRPENPERWSERTGLPLPWGVVEE